MRKRSIASQNNLSFGLSFSLNSTVGDDFIAFSGISGEAPFVLQLKSGMIFCQGHFIDSYTAGEIIRCSGNLNDTYDLYINNEAKIIGANIGSYEYDWIVYSQNSLQNLSVAIQGDEPNYSILSQPYFYSGDPVITGYIVNNSDQRIRFFSGDSNSSLFDLSGLTTTNLGPNETGYFYLIPTEDNFEGYFNIPVQFYTNFGNFLYNYETSGIVNITKDAIFNVAYDNNALGYNTYKDIIVSYLFNTNFEIDIKLEHISGSGLYYIDIPASGLATLYADPIFIVESGNIIYTGDATGSGIGGRLNQLGVGVFSASTELFQWATGTFNTTLEAMATGWATGFIPDNILLGYGGFGGTLSGNGNWLSGYYNGPATGTTGGFTYTGWINGPVVVHFNSVFDGFTSYSEIISAQRSTSVTTQVPFDMSGLFNGLWSGDTVKSGRFGTSTSRWTGNRCGVTVTLTTPEIAYWTDPASTGYSITTTTHMGSGVRNNPISISYTGISTGLGTYTPDPESENVYLYAGITAMPIGTGYFCGDTYYVYDRTTSNITATGRNSYFATGYNGPVQGLMIDASGLFIASGTVSMPVTYTIYDGSGSHYFYQRVSGNPSLVQSAFPTGYSNATASFEFGTPSVGDYIAVDNLFFVYNSDYSGGASMALAINNASGDVSASWDGTYIHLTANVSGHQGNDIVWATQGFNFAGLSGGQTYYAPVEAVSTFITPNNVSRYLYGSGWYSGTTTGMVYGEVPVLDWQKTFTGSWNLFTGNTPNTQYNYYNNGNYTTNQYENVTFEGVGNGSINNLYISVNYLNDYLSGNDVVKLTISGRDNSGFETGIEIYFQGLL